MGCERSWKGSRGGDGWGSALAGRMTRWVALARGEPPVLVFRGRAGARRVAGGRRGSVPESQVFSFTLMTPQRRESKNRKPEILTGLRGRTGQSAGGCSPASGPGMATGSNSAKALAPRPRTSNVQ